MSKKYYAVAVGRKPAPGIFEDWDFVKGLVSGYSGAIFKSFRTYNEAQAFLQPYGNLTMQGVGVDAGPLHYNISMDTGVPTANASSSVGNNANAILVSQPSPIPQVQKSIVYTDGSFMNNASGYGLVVIFPTAEVYHCYGRVPAAVGNTNNVAELYAIYVALSAIPTGEMDIYTDSQYAIDVIAGTKRAHVNQDIIAAIQSKMDGRKVSFYHVYAHTGVHLNEIVDNLAKLGSTQDDEEPHWITPYQETGGGPLG